MCNNAGCNCPKPRTGLKLDLDKPVQTVRGEPVTILAKSRKTNSGYPVVAMILHSYTGEESAAYYSIGGSHVNVPQLDLVNIPDIVTFDCWLVVFGNATNRYYVVATSLEELQRLQRCFGYVSHIKVFQKVEVQS